MSIDLKDYVDVAERIGIFREKYPNGSLQSEVIQYGPDVVIVKALAYRTPDDVRPGIGHASEVLPGKTPYTRDSELMVCETSAWGRAIVAVLAADTKRGVASKDEVARAQANQSVAVKNGNGKPAPKPAPKAAPAPVAVKEADGNKATPAQWGLLLQRFGSQASTVKAARERFEDAVASATDITFLQAEALLEGSK